WPDDGLLQKVAFENGLSETAFFVRRGPAAFELRWFTPSVEVDLCGHATVASGHVLFHERGQKGDRIAFVSRSGPLSGTRRRDGKLELDFPALPAAPVPTPDALVTALGRAPDEVHRSPQRWLCVYPDAATVRSLKPDHPALARLELGRFVVTAPGSDCDFVSR